MSGHIVLRRETASLAFLVELKMITLFLQQLHTHFENRSQDGEAEVDLPPSSIFFNFEDGQSLSKERPFNKLGAATTSN
jgi:hypothetical protein